MKSAAIRIRNIKILMAVISVVLAGAVVFICTIDLDYGSKTISAADGYITMLQLLFLIFTMSATLLDLYFVLKDAKEDLAEEKKHIEPEG